MYNIIIDRQAVGKHKQIRGTDMRVVKEAEERKNEILDVAQELFSKNGF